MPSDHTSLAVERPESQPRRVCKDWGARLGREARMDERVSLESFN